MKAINYDDCKALVLYFSAVADRHSYGNTLFFRYLTCGLIT